jgi:BirA family transcriptional regulator, biotin operon repressor / biotin---[acetyl-CoA-carboxylase] ligase
MSSPDNFKARLDAFPQPWELIRVQSIDSTNLELSRRLCATEKAPRLVLWAEEQTQGQGRLDRRWKSVAGEDITASVCFPSTVNACDVPKLSLIAGLSLAYILTEDFGIDAQVKWPNDVMASGGKIAGILSSYLNLCHGVICGIGINVNSEKDAFELEPGRVRTTLKIETGREVSRESLFIRWIAEFEKNWPMAEEGNIERLCRAYDKFDFYKNKKVRVYCGAGSDRGCVADYPFIEGSASGLDSSGALRVRLDDGGEYLVTVDDVVDCATGSLPVKG